MAFTAEILRSAFAELPTVEDDDAFSRGKGLAIRLHALLDTGSAESEVAEVDLFGREVILVTKGGDYWTIECLSADAFRMYPGFERNGVVTWANVWVRDTDMDLDELVKDINDVAYRTTKKELANA